MKSHVPYKTTATEQKALNREINRQLAENIRRLERDIDAIILWELHEQLGFGETRLRRFYNNFSVCLRELTAHYETDDGDREWLCAAKLRAAGIDFDKWPKDEKIFKGAKMK